MFVFRIAGMSHIRTSSRLEARQTGSNEDTDA